MARAELVIFGMFAILIIGAMVTSLVVTFNKSRGRDKRSGAVASDATLCNRIGKNIMEKDGGNAVDSAVATIFCLGVVNPMSLGIGGGGFMVVHDNVKQMIKVYDYRVQAPAGSTENMFVDRKNLTKYGGLAVAIPGQVRGLKLAHDRHGHLPWKDLFNETINLAENGFTIHKPLGFTIYTLSFEKYVSQGLKNLVQNKEDGRWLRTGDIMRNPELGKTLKIIRENPEDFYVGNLAKSTVADVNAEGGNKTLEDLSNYKVKVRNTLNISLSNGLILHVAPTPAGGAPLAMLQNILSGYNFKENKLESIEEQFDFYQPYIESMKFAFAQRGLLGDPDFLPDGDIEKVERMCTNLTIGDLIRRNKIKMNETHYNMSYYEGVWGEDDHGTSHTSVYSSDGISVSSTNTINLYFGGKVRSPTTGIIFNNLMDDFSTPEIINYYGLPPTPANYIKPGKRPQSSACPTIVTDGRGRVRMILGASGGTKIISAVSEVLAKKLYLKGINLQDAIKSFRLHNQGKPNTTTFYKRKSYNHNTTTQYTVPDAGLLSRLTSVGHILTRTNSADNVQAIFISPEGKVSAMSDARKDAIADGFNCIVYNATHEIKL